MLSSRAAVVANSAVDARAGKPRLAVEALAELFLREAAELLGLPFQTLIEPDDRQAERRRERDRRRRDDRDDQPGTERREAKQKPSPRPDTGPHSMTGTPPMLVRTVLRLGRLRIADEALASGVTVDSLCTNDKVTALG